MIGVPFSHSANYLADAFRLINIPVGAMLVGLMIREVWHNHDDMTRRYTLLSEISFVAAATYSQIVFLGTVMTPRTALTFVGTVLGVIAAIRRVLEK